MPVATSTLAPCSRSRQEVANGDDDNNMPLIYIAAGATDTTWLLALVLVPPLDKTGMLACRAQKRRAV